MTDEQVARQARWHRSRAHLAAARSFLANFPATDLATFQEYLDQNELGLAFE